jgi:hypothetical protein
MIEQLVTVASRRKSRAVRTKVRQIEKLDGDLAIGVSLTSVQNY